MVIPRGEYLRTESGSGLRSLSTVTLASENCNRQPSSVWMAPNLRDSFSHLSSYCCKKFNGTWQTSKANKTPSVGSASYREQVPPCLINFPLQFAYKPWEVKVFSQSPFRRRERDSSKAVRKPRRVRIRMSISWPLRPYACGQTLCVCVVYVHVCVVMCMCVCVHVYTWVWR